MSTITYTVTVVSSKFIIDGSGPSTKLTFRDGDTYIFDQSDSSNSGHTLQFSITDNNSGSAEYTTGVTKTGTAGQAGAKTTIITSGSTTDTLYYYSSGGGTYGSEFSNSGYVQSTDHNILKPKVGDESSLEKWGPMVNHAYDQIDQVLTSKLSLAGGAMTGAITTNSTFDGIDIATRDAILTSTTTTAGAALPKAGGTMSGTITGLTGLTGGTGDFNWDSNTLVVDSSANKVGIGIAAPTADLHLHSVNGGYIRWTTDDETPEGAIIGYNAWGNFLIDNMENSPMHFYTNALVRLTIAAGGDLETSTTNKIKQKGAFMQSSTHQALFLGG